ncbi:tetratricopeptide repeat protein [Helicobacter felis]|uniref:tetratricopeptide repeat protein n=1 Tax=Helicobacter felis TaxID=214 RepID=UPI000CF0BD2A|nr:SEL1-like repeat protein [Helicobacter felis]
MLLRIKNNISVLLVLILLISTPLRAYGSYQQQVEQVSSLVQAGLEARSQGQFEKAFENFHAAYQSGDNLGEVFLGMAYMRGQGVRQDGKMAKQYFESVLRKYKGEQRYKFLPVAAALFGLARMYEKGLGVKQNMGKALKFYKKIVMYSGGEGRPLGYLGMMLAYFIIPVFLIFVKNVRLKNLKVEDFDYAPMLKSLVSQTLYNMGIIYQKRHSKHKAKKFLQKAVDFSNEDAMNALRAMER